MSDIMKDNGQNSNPGNSQEDHLTGDGQPDRRFKEHGGGTHGNQGGRLTGFDQSGDGTSRLVTEGTGEDEGFHKPSLHGNQKKDGSEDKRTSSEHGFGGDRERAQEAGRKGGAATSTE